MKNLFEGSKFGDKFITRDGRLAILISLSDIAVLAVEITQPIYMKFLQLECYLDGNINNENIPNSYDIVSRYQEPIDEEKLCIDKCDAASRYIPIENKGGNSEIASIRRCSFSDGFEAGYRKAKEK